MKASEWFDGRRFIPAHVGVYKRMFGNVIMFSYWDGKGFSLGCESVFTAIIFKGNYSPNKNLLWCGLAEKP